jgi:CUB/sushi domain-containing protein
MEVFESRLGQPTYVNWTDPDVTDNTGADVTLQCSHQSGSAFSAGVTKVNYTATDVNGLQRKCHFTITVVSEYSYCR